LTTAHSKGGRLAPALDVEQLRKQAEDLVEAGEAAGLSDAQLRYGFPELAAPEGLCGAGRGVPAALSAGFGPGRPYRLLVRH
jgi:hypothetical protein